MTKTLKIPSAWLMGFLTANPDLEVKDAVAWWLDQLTLADEWEQQHDGAH